MDPFATLSDWPGRTAAAVVQPDGSVERWGDTAEPFALASVTKLLTAMRAVFLEWVFGCHAISVTERVVKAHPPNE